MAEDIWEEFARTDAEFYIYSVDVDFSTPEGREHFFSSGRADAKRLLDEVGPHLREFDLAIEIGCGIGRLAIPISEQFNRVIGVDISPTMLQKLSAMADEFGRSNLSGMLDSQPWDSTKSADLIYSHLVFQHIEDFQVIDAYFGRIAEALKPEGVCYAQFDTRPQSLVYKVRALLPDVLLPRTSKRGIRRTRRNPSDLKEMFSRRGLSVVKEVNPRTVEHVFLLRGWDPKPDG